MIFEFEVLSKEFGHLPSFLTPQLLVLEHPGHIGYSKRRSSHKYKGRGAYLGISMGDLIIRSVNDVPLDLDF